MRVKPAQEPDAAQGLEVRGEVTSDTCHHGLETRVRLLSHPPVHVSGELGVDAGPVGQHGQHLYLGHLHCQLQELL